MQHDIVLKKSNSNLNTPMVRQNLCYHVATFRVLISLDMQHDNFFKKLNSDLLTPSPRGRGGMSRGSVGKLFATMLLKSLFLLI